MRARSALRAERLNHARDVWGQVHALPDAVRQLILACGISPRQAYRDLQAARRLRAPVPIPEATIAFTVKLSRRLVRELRAEAASTGLSLSAIVSRAITAQLARSRGRG
jgi:predicted DNA-binding transcriptional regulator YafY